MLRRSLSLLLCAFSLGSCTERAEAVRAAEPHVETFARLRARALDLLELRADVERKKLLYAAMHDEDATIPENLEPLVRQMESQNAEITEEELERGEALFWSMLDRAFSEDPDVMQGEIVFLEKDGTISAFRHPRDREVPAGVKWYGLRQQRTFAGLASCVTDDGSAPCVLVQLRPRDYSGSAGLTVAFRRAP